MVRHFGWISVNIAGHGFSSRSFYFCKNNRFHPNSSHSHCYIATYEEILDFKESYMKDYLFQFKYLNATMRGMRVGFKVPK
jgi:hypothetical protein